MSFPGWRQASSDAEESNAGRVRDTELPGDAMKNVAEEFPFDERWDGTSGRRRLRDHPRRARREAFRNEGRPGRLWGKRWQRPGRPRGLGFDQPGPERLPHPRTPRLRPRALHATAGARGRTAPSADRIPYRLLDSFGRAQPQRGRRPRPTPTKRTAENPARGRTRTVRGRSRGRERASATSPSRRERRRRCRRTPLILEVDDVEQASHERVWWDDNNDTVVAVGVPC